MNRTSEQVKSDLTVVETVSRLFSSKPSNMPQDNESRTIRQAADRKGESSFHSGK